MAIIVDTSVLWAILDRRDQHHNRAIRHLVQLKPQKRPFHIPRIAKIEFFGHLKRAKGADKRLRLETLEKLESLAWSIVDHHGEDHVTAEQWWRSYADWPVDYSDVLMVATAKRIKATIIWTHDRQMAAFVKKEAQSIIAVGTDPHLE